MNYIELINNFWKFYDLNKLKINTSDIALYFVILRYCNKLNWINPFSVNPFIISEINPLSINTYYKSLKNLNELKLIKWEKGKNNISNSKITILNFNTSTNNSIDNSIKFSTTNSVTNSVTNSTTTSTTNSVVNNNKTIKQLNNKTREKQNSLTPLEIIKKDLVFWELFQMQNKKLIKDWDKMIYDWECKVDEEGMEYDTKKLKGRLKRWCNNWASNEDKFKKQKKEILPFATNR